MCTYLKSPFILKRERVRERIMHGEGESCLLSPCDMDRFVLWGLLLNINVCGCDRSRVFHPKEQTAAHRSRVARLTLSLQSTTKNNDLITDTQEHQNAEYCHGFTKNLIFAIHTALILLMS